jgi:hypothetical protein
LQIWQMAENIYADAGNDEEEDSSRKPVAANELE